MDERGTFLDLVEAGSGKRQQLGYWLAFETDTNREFSAPNHFGAAGHGKERNGAE